MYFTKEDFQQIEAWFKVNAWKDTDFTRISPEDMGNEDIIAVVHDGTNCAIPYTDLIGYITDIVNPSEIVTVLSYNDLPNPGEENNLYIIASTGDLYRYNGNTYQKVGFPASSAGLGLKIDSNGNLNINLQTDEHRDDDQYTLEIEDKETEAKVLDITIPPADTSYAGVMSAADKAKLNSIPSDANNYILKFTDTHGSTPVEVNMLNIADSNTIKWSQETNGWQANLQSATREYLGGVKVYGYLSPGTGDYADFPIGIGTSSYTSLQDMGIARIPYATTNDAGLMSPQDKVKLDSAESSVYYLDAEGDPPTYTLMETICDSSTIGWTFGADGWEAYSKYTLPQATNAVLGGIKIPYSGVETSISTWDGGTNVKGYHGLGVDQNHLLHLLLDSDSFRLKNGTEATLTPAEGIYTSRIVRGMFEQDMHKFKSFTNQSIYLVVDGTYQGSNWYTSITSQYFYDFGSQTSYEDDIKSGIVKCKIDLSSITGFSGYPKVAEEYLYENNGNIFMVLTSLSILKGNTVTAQLTFNSTYTQVTNVTITGL